jgi:hypothetical protein
MAPEVGVGKYDRSIDVYALGALLYEMLTGMVPFVGSSPTEILFKHLSAEADCSGIPEPFCSAIKRAMEKDPTKRFQTVQELVESVFGAEHVRNSVSQFSPLELSVVAGRVAARIATPVGVAAGGAGSGGAAGGSSVTSPNGLGSPKGAPEAAPRRITSSLFAPLQDTTPAADPFSLRHRIILGLVATLAISVAAQAFAGIRDEGEAFFYTALAIAGASAAMLVTGRVWLPRPKAGHHVADRFALAGAAALGAIALSGILWMDWRPGRQFTPGMFVALLASLAWANPRRWLMSDRLDRISFKSAVFAGVIAFVAAAIFAGSPVLAIAIAGGAALVVQVLTPWDERAAQRRAELDGDDDDDPIRGFEPVMPPRASAQAGGLLGTLAQTASPRAATWPPGAQPIPALNYWPVTGQRYVPRGMSVVWFTGVLVFFITGVLLHVVAANESNWNDFAAFSAFCVVMYATTFFCFRRMRVRTFNTWWEYLILPSLRHVCVLVVLFCWAMLGFGRGWSRSDEEGFMVTIVIFAMLWLLSWTIGWLWRMAVPPLPPMPPPVPQSLTPAAPQAPAKPATPAFELGAALGEVRAAVETAVTNTRDAVREAVHGARDAAVTARARVRRARPDVLGVCAYVIGIAALFVAYAIAFGLALDLPGMIAAGLPDPHVREGIQRDIFNNSEPNWPAVLRDFFTVIVSVLGAVALAAFIFARRRANWLHILRAPIGVVGMLLSTGFLYQIVHLRQPWSQIGSGPTPRAWPAMRELLRCFNTPEVALFVLFMVAAATILCWPRRRAAYPSASVQQEGAAA